MDRPPTLYSQADIMKACRSGAKFRIDESIICLNFKLGSALDFTNLGEALKENSSVVSVNILANSDVPDCSKLLDALNCARNLRSLCVQGSQAKAMLASVGNFLQQNSIVAKLNIAEFVKPADNSTFLQGLERNSSLVRLKLHVTTLEERKKVMNAFSVQGTLLNPQSVELDPLVLERTVLPVAANSFERSIKHGNWEELAKLLKDTCTHRVANQIYSATLDLSTKTFVDKLAVHTLKTLHDETNKEEAQLKNSFYQSSESLKSLLKKELLLQAELDRIKKEIQLTGAQARKEEEELQAKRHVQHILTQNLQNFKSALSQNEPALQRWQQKLQTDLGTWSCEDVSFLLSEIGLQTYVQTFLANKIDGSVLKVLDTGDMTMNLNLSFKNAKRLLMHIYLIETYHDIYMMPPGVLQWNNDTVCTWLEDNKFGHLVDVFKKHEIIGAELVFLEKADLNNYLKIQALGDVIKLQKEFSKLKNTLNNDLHEQLYNNNNNAFNNQMAQQLEEMKRFNDELKRALKDREAKIPEAFICPITQDMMTDPVVASDGHTYERTAIELWLKNNNSSPMTGLQLSNKQLTPSHTLKSMIREFIDANKKK